MSYSHLKLKILEGKFNYALFASKAELLSIANELNVNKPAAFFFAAEEASAILPEDVVIKAKKIESDWACIRIVGDMPFGTVQGLIATISTQLKNHGLGICVVSTFLTDWFFIKAGNLEKALGALKSSGWQFDE